MFNPHAMKNKRNLGQYFTQYNPFDNEGFLNWAKACAFEKSTILEPFAGSNNLIKMLQEMNLCKEFQSFDIEPKCQSVTFKDTLKDFPQDFNICITNPPYLAQNSAKRRGLEFPTTKYDDLYKYALSKCLENCENVGAIIPASFLNSKLFRDRLSCYILLNTKMFNDTEHPVCLALFKKKSKDVEIFEDKKYLGLLSKFEKKMPKPILEVNMKFNDKVGKLGLLAIDNTIEPSIKFCDGSQIDPSKISVSSRSITRISIDADIPKLIKNLNEKLTSFRCETYDLFLTPFKGLRKDNKYRRRLDYSLARDVINQTLLEI
jgi:hypothetical protein